MNAELIAEVSRKIWDLAQFHNGLATVPAYLLEQLALYTEIIGPSDLDYNEMVSTPRPKA